MLSHKPWIGSQAAIGVENQRVAVVGFSHWKKPEENDYEDMTVETIQNVISGRWYDIRFFTDIAGYFGFERPSEFWPRVVFFNFLPNVVGDADERFGDGNRDQVVSGGKRALSIYGENRIDKAFVFSRKGWNNHPATIEEQSGHGNKLGVSDFTWGHYERDGWSTAAIGLRHPQGASGALMRAAVTASIQIPLLKKS